MIGTQQPVGIGLDVIVARWGNPWHGLVSGGELNGATWAQPTRGDTYIIQPPGQPAVSTPPAESTLGMEWRNYALLSGYNHQLYGQNIGATAWIYIASDGTAWRVNAASLLNTDHTLSSALSVSITLDRFGVFGGTPASTSAIVTLADWQQVAAPLLPADAGVYSVADITVGQLRLHDLTPDGRRAILMLVAPTPDYYYNVDDLGSAGNHTNANVARPLGFYELTISDTVSGGDITPAANLTILANRETTIGIAASSTAQTETTVTGEVYEYPDLSAVICATMEHRNGIRSWTISDRIIAYWYQGSTATPVTMDIDWSQSATGSATLGLTCSKSQSYTDTITTTIYGPHGNISHTQTATDSYGETRTIDPDTGIIDNAVSGTQTVSSTTLDEVTWSYINESTTNVSSDTGTFDSADSCSATGGSVAYPAHANSDLNAWRYAGTTPDIGAGRLMIWRYSNNLIGFAQNRSYIPIMADGVGGYCQPRIKSAAGKAGNSTTAASSVVNDQLWYGSQQPVTGETVIGSEVAVCWV